MTKLMSLEADVKGDLMGCIQQLVVRRDSDAGSTLSDALDADGLTPSQVQQLVAQKEDLEQLYVHVSHMPHRHFLYTPHIHVLQSPHSHVST